MTERKKERGCIFAVRDFCDAFPAASPDQKQVLIYLALFADPDGSNIRPGFARLNALGLHRRYIGPAIRFWIDLRVLILTRPGTPGRGGRAAEYRIDVQRLVEFGSTVEPISEDNSVPTSEPISEPISVPDSPISVPKRPDIGSNVGTAQEQYNGNSKITGAEEEESSPNGSPSAATLAAFELLDDNQPFGSLAFQAIWTHICEQRKDALDVDNLPEVMEECLQICQHEGIKVAPPFFRSKRMAEFARQSAIRNRLSEDHIDRLRKNAALAGLEPLNPKK
jgi:hypothetical protein